MTADALPRRFSSAVSISTSWRRRVTRAPSTWVAASGSGRTGGRTASAKCARTWASMASVWLTYRSLWQRRAPGAGSRLRPVVHNSRVPQAPEARSPRSPRARSSRPQSSQPRHQSSHACRIVGGVPQLARRPHSDLQTVYVDADEDLSRRHVPSHLACTRPTLRMRARGAAGNCSGSRQDQAETTKLTRGLSEPEGQRPVPSPNLILGSR